MALCDFYENSDIFVTGGSGVVGKALIEKLLRSCNVNRIYVLLRPRRQYTVEQRLERLRKAKIFELLRDLKPNELDKLVAVPGDVSLPMLGISPEDAMRMAQVSLIFHCAATVRFDEPLRVALRLNVGGTLEALKFAQTLRQLRVFMHVSTFFSNPYLKRVESKLYDSPMDWRKCLRMADAIKDDELLDTLTRKLIVGFPNTYTFTKNLAESLINDYRDKLPVIIFRPSIVLFAARDPVPGFAPSLMGAMGIFTLVGAGILKTVYLGENVRLDITPQDVGIKTMIYYARHGFQSYQKGTPAELPVYTSSSCTHIPFTFKQMATTMERKDYWYSAAFEKNLLLPGCYYTDNRFVYKLLVLTHQIFPALIVDMLLVLFGRKPAIMAIQRKGYGTLEVMKPFMFNVYDSPGTSHIKEMLEATRGSDFDVTDEFENAHIKDRMERACKDMIASVRYHLMNEQPETLQRAQRILKAKLYIYNGIRLLLLYKLLAWIWRSYL